MDIVYFEGDGAPRDLHVRTHYFPALRSADLQLMPTDSAAARMRKTVRACRAAPRSTRSVGIAAPRIDTEPMDRVVSSDGSAVMVTPSAARSEEHTSELQSLMRISYAVFCLQKKTISTSAHPTHQRCTY